MQREEDTLTKKNEKVRSFFPFVIIFVLLLVGLTIYKYKDTLANCIKKIGFLPQSNQDVVKEDTNDNSVFKNLVTTGESDTEENTNVFTPEVLNNLELADSFDRRVKDYGYENWDKLVEENQVILEVNKDPEGDVFYSFVNSKNPNFKFERGAVVDFKPTLKTPASLVVMEGIKTQFAYKEGDFSNLEEDIFKSGDKIIFLCDLSSCEDGVTKWLLVYRY